MTTPAKGPHSFRRYFHRALSDVKPDLSSPSLGDNIWIVEMNEDIIFNVKVRMIHSAATPATFDIVIYELSSGNVADIVSSYTGRAVQNAIWSQTYSTMPAPVAHPRMLALVFTNVSAAMDYEFWVT